MPKIINTPKIIIDILLVNWNHRVLPEHVVKMKRFTIHE